MVDGFLASQTKGKGGAGKQATGAGDRAAAGAVATLDAVADGASTATAATAAPAATAAGDLFLRKSTNAPTVSTLPLMMCLLAKSSNESPGL